jgi:flagellar hook-basal body protein
MEPIMSILLSISGLLAAQKSIAITSDNIANVSTTGHKGTSISFADIMGSMPMEASNGITGQGVQVNETQRDFKTGSFSVTGSATDLAVSGSALFLTSPKNDILSDNIPRSDNYLTRNGSFIIDNSGYIVTRENHNLLDTNLNPFRLPVNVFSDVEAHYISNKNIEVGTNHSGSINNSTLTFSANAEASQIDWVDENEKQYKAGDILTKDSELFLVESGGVDNSKTAVKIGEISKPHAGILELNFGDPVIKSPVKALKLVDVEKTFDIEVEELVTKQVTTSEPVLVDKIEVTKEKFFLDTYSTQMADFSSQGWVTSNSRFFTEKTLVNGFPSPKDPSFGNIESNYETYEDSPEFGKDDGQRYSGKLSSQILDLGSTVILTTGNGSGASFQTTRGPYINSTSPISLKGGTSVNFDWYTKGSRDAYDLFVYLRNVDNGQYTIAINETGIGDLDADGYVEDLPISGNYSFNVPEDGRYDLVFVSGTWDASGYGGAGAESKISNLTYQAKDFEFRDVEKTVQVWEQQDVTREVQVLETVIRPETRTVSELQEFTIYEDVPMALDVSLLEKIGAQIRASQNLTIEGSKIDPLQINVEFSSNSSPYFKDVLKADVSQVITLSKETVFKKFDSLNVDPQGKVSVSGVYGTNGDLDLGSIAFGNPIRASKLTYTGNGYFKSGKDSPDQNIGSITEVDGGKVVQGALEISNIDLTYQLSNLIQSQVVFHANSRAIQAYADANQKLQDIS